MMASGAVPSEMLVESTYAWRRLAASLALSTIGGVGHVVGRGRAAGGAGRVRRRPRRAPRCPTPRRCWASPSAAMLMGRLADRFGIVPPLVVASIALSLGYFLSAWSPGLGQFVLVQGLVIGMFGSSATFAPLVADVSHWFTRRRGIAVVDLRQRELPGRHRLAADPPALHGDAGMAADHGRRRDLLCPDHAAAHPHAAPALADRARAGPGGRCLRCRPRASLARASAGAPHGRGPRHAASPCRCRRSTSSPTAAISATGSRAAPRCSP